MKTQFNPEYLKEDGLEIRVFSKDLEEQKQLNIKNNLILERGIKTIKNIKETNKRN